MEPSTTSEKVALTDVEIKEIWHLFVPNYNYHLVELDELKDDLPLFSMVFTGNEKNKFNKGNSRHWLGIFDDHLFDSYGLKNQPYVLPDFIKKENNPQLQAWGSSVCGEYVLVFFNFVSKIIEDNKEVNHQDIIRMFMESYDLSINSRHNNDEIILNAFIKIRNGEQ